MPDDQCPEYWGNGIKWNLFHRCDRPAKHTSWHVNKAASMKWTGKLTDAERELIPA